MGNRRTLKNGLTPKQQKFTNIVLKQIADTGEVNGTEAAAQTYPVKNRKTASAIGAENLNKPAIKEQIEIALNKQGLTPDLLLSNIGKIATAEPEKVTGETVLKSNIELLKLLGAYPEKNGGKFSFTVKQNVQNFSFSEAKQKLSEFTSESSEFVSDADELETTP